MNKRQKKKSWRNIQNQRNEWAKHGIHIVGGGIMLPHGYVYNKKGCPIQLV